MTDILGNTACNKLACPVARGVVGGGGGAMEAGGGGRFVVTLSVDLYLISPL